MLLWSFILIVLNVFSQQNIIYKYDREAKRISYDTVCIFADIKSEKIKESIVKFLASENIEISFSDDADIYVFHDFKAKYKNGLKSRIYNVSCKLHFQIKDNKFKFSANSFLCRDGKVIATANSVQWTEGITSTKIKSSWEKTVAEVFYAHKRKDKYQIFPSINTEMQRVIEGAVLMINPPKSTW